MIFAEPPVTVLNPLKLPFPRTENLPRKDRWSRLPECKVLEDVSVEIIVGGRRVRITILAGFIYDGASLPGIAALAGWHPNDPETALASALHDALFVSMGGRLAAEFVRVEFFGDDKNPLSRVEVDSVLSTVMRWTKCSPLRAGIYFDACHAFGAAKWNSHAKSA